MIFDFLKITKLKHRFKCIQEVWYKQCSKCKEFKILETEFTKDKNTSCGKTPNCNECRGLKKMTPEYRQKWYKNSGKIKKQEYYQKNKQSIHIQREQSRKKDPLKLINQRVRKFIRKNRLKTGFKKQSKSNEIIGCSKRELYDYLINTFEINYKIKYEEKYFKDLHIDHKIPLSTVKTEKESLLLNHYTNLQFLYKEHNMQKKSKLNYIIPPFPVELFQ